MQNTTQPASFESISPDILFQISGGCGGCCHHHCCAPCAVPAASPVQQTQIIMPQIAGSTLPPQAQAVDPSALQAAAAPSGPTVTTNVSINGVPTATA